MTHDEMISELERYPKRVRLAYSYFDSYFSIMTGVQNYADEINLSHGFFRVVEKSLYDSLLLELARLYSHKKTEKRSEHYYIRYMPT